MNRFSKDIRKELVNPLHWSNSKKMDEVLSMINNVGNSGNKEQDLVEIANSYCGGNCFETTLHGWQ